MPTPGHGSKPTDQLPPIRGPAGLNEPQPLKKKRKKRNPTTILRNIARANEGFKQSILTSSASYHPSNGEDHLKNDFSPQLVRSNSEQRSSREPADHEVTSHAQQSQRKSYAKRFTVSQFDAFRVGQLGNPEMTQLSARERLSCDQQELLKTLYTKPERTRVDYVLVYKEEEEQTDAKKLKSSRMRQMFESLLLEQGFSVQKETINKFVYVKLQCCFPRLCMEAEKVKLQLPLKGMKINPEADDYCCATCVKNRLVTDDEVDFVSAAFEQEKLFLFENYETPDKFFRSSIRSLLVHHIMQNLDLRKSTQKEHHEADKDNESEDALLSRQGLPFLLMKKVYETAFILHDVSRDDFKESHHYHSSSRKSRDSNDMKTFKPDLEFYGDARHELNVTWPLVCKFQPLWKIRDYFGEEIGLYFAWLGVLIRSLIIPLLCGLAVFAFGLHESITQESQTLQNTTLALTNVSTTTTSDLGRVVSATKHVVELIKQAFDNSATPFYAIIICLWGTVFLEWWKRTNAVLAYEWDVDQYEEDEPDRPEYSGMKGIDPVTGETIQVYPLHLRFIKYSVSLACFTLMVCLVIAGLIAVILYRVVIDINYCGSWNDQSPAYCVLVSTVCSSLLNAILILILGKVYELVAYKLTDWENHQTQSTYQDSLIVKLFAFQFVNCYSSLYYIAFFRGNLRQLFGDKGMFNLGGEYTDTCSSDGENTPCMPMLSFQVLVLMIVKPLPKFLKDVIIPSLLKLWRLCRSRASIDPESPNHYSARSLYLETEKNKPPLGDFTLAEYTEKVILYGFLMLFAAAMPLAPLIALCTALVDKSVDAKRLIWMYKRPIATIAEDIGMWYNILQFLNVAGVITNAFLIAYLSEWGRVNYQSAAEKLWLVLIFEHVVFAIKYLLSVVIPDVPSRINIAMRKEKFTVAQILETGAFTRKAAVTLSSSAGSPLAPLAEVDGDKLLSKDDTVASMRNVQVDTSNMPAQHPTRSSQNVEMQRTGDNSLRIHHRESSSGSRKFEYGPDGSTFMVS